MGRLKPICVLSRRWGIQKGGKGTGAEVVTKATRLPAPLRFTFHCPFSDDQPHPIFVLFSLPSGSQFQMGL
ncbi:hypothetical protein CEXT_390571 [Caerostris extrusa]|uniref:Uncharacterized protein n=1 Tax=Caerostris extrusa TaxID=172846 RepID=A0AAV4YEU2_CAEEX|nr:hypothetical protein CEXT_390571 [Caerostris extrusa]